MRTAFIKELIRHAEINKKLMLITGDLGFGVLDEFEKQFPSQFINAGVAEQNMTAIATGLALEGYTAFTYSIGNFPTLRCLEQIRNDACYHQANVKVVSVGGGFSYGQLGMSHHATEDLSILRALPGIAVCAPTSAYETTCLVDAIINIDGPVYLRLERAAPSYADDSSIPFVFGKAREIRKGNDITLVASGGVIAEVVAASDELARRGIICRVLSMHTLKPLDNEAIFNAARETNGIVTVEENSVLGGLGGAVAEICLEHDVRPKVFRRLGIKDTYVSIVGDQSYLRTFTGLNSAAIVASVVELLSRR